MSNEQIKEGDIVEVQFERCDWFTGKVLYLPCATGDSWHIEDAAWSITLRSNFRPNY